MNLGCQEVIPMGSRRTASVPHVLSFFELESPYPLGAARRHNRCIPFRRIPAMPSVVNGVGTWYCGKRRIHRVKAVCSQCNSLTELESYDTTLFFVVLFVPIIPLGQKRILESCPACRRHRQMPLNKWEEAKSAAFNGVLEDLRANPDDKNTIQKALATATIYQDELVFDRLAGVLAGHRTSDAEIQSQIGGAYEYFSRWADAENAYRQALAVAPNDHLHERLAVCLLKQNRPEEAAPFVSHIFDQQDP